MSHRTRERLRLSLVVAAAAALFLPRPGLAAETNAPPAPDRVSLTHHILWYLPNRFLDLTDVLRARVRVGPGLALNIHFTRWVNFYAGEYHAVYLGLPGPRVEPVWPLPAGLEQEKGLALLGVDATDTLPHEPAYSDTEITAGAHVLLVGAEAGFDLVEAADFLFGFFLLDPRRDDH